MTNYTEAWRNSIIDCISIDNDILELSIAQTALAKRRPGKLENLRIRARFVFSGVRFMKFNKIKNGSVILNVSIVSLEDNGVEFNLSCIDGAGINVLASKIVDVEF